MSKSNNILIFLKRYRAIDHGTAHWKYGVTDLPRKIHYLKSKGYDIKYDSKTNKYRMYGDVAS